MYTFKSGDEQWETGEPLDLFDCKTSFIFNKEHCLEEIWTGQYIQHPPPEFVCVDSYYTHLSL